MLESRGPTATQPRDSQHGGNLNRAFDGNTVRAGNSIVPCGNCDIRSEWVYCALFHRKPERRLELRGGLVPAGAKKRRTCTGALGYTGNPGIDAQSLTLTTLPSPLPAAAHDHLDDPLPPLQHFFDSRRGCRINRAHLMDSSSSNAAADGTDISAVGRVRKRAPEACTFCRRRKARGYMSIKPNHQ